MKHSALLPLFPHRRHHLLTVALLATALGAAAHPIITDVVETGGDNEATDTITAKWTGVTWNTTMANEPTLNTPVGTPYTVGLFGNNAPAFVDRAHAYTHASATVLIPSYLLGGEYIMSGNDNRDNASYRLDVTIATPAYVYLLIDNRLQDGDGNTPPTFGPANMQWVLDQGWTPVQTGVNRSANSGIPDEIGIDESADGSINQWYSIYMKVFPAGTFTLLQADNSGRNMYGVVIKSAFIPVPPTNVTVLKMDGRAQLSWSAAPNALSYNVKRSELPGGPYVTVTNVTGTTHADTELINGVTYYYVVSTIAATGESANSAEVSVTPGAAPANLVAALQVTEATLTWDPLPGAATYNVRRATATGGPYTLLTSTLTDTNYVDSSLATGTRYFYIVSANLSAGGESANSLEASVLTAPGVPQNLTAVTNLPLQTIVGWTLTDPVVEGFIVELSTDGGTQFNVLGMTPGNTFVFTNKVQPTTPYWYRVQATNSTGFSAFSSPLAVTSPVFSVNINFQLNISSNYPGFFPDLGAVYGEQNNGFSYGWDVSNTGNARQRGSVRSPDYLHDTLNHMQKVGGGSVWEIEVPNGTYELRLAGGDPDNADSYLQMLAEGLIVLEGTPFGGGNSFWVSATNTITVADGRLTLSNGPKAVNNKINFIEIIPTNPAPPVVSVPATQFTLQEAREASFRVNLVSGTLPVNYQWYAPTGAIADATNTTLVVSNLALSHAGDYFVVAANLQGSVTSAPITLTVEADTTPGELILAHSLDGRTVGVRFSERMDAAQAADAPSYAVLVNEVPVYVPAATLRPDQQSVLLTLDETISGPFVVRSDFIADLSPQMNMVQSYVTGVVSHYSLADIGAPAITGAVFSCQPQTFEVTAGGADFGGTADQGHFLWTNWTGNFDVRVRVETLTWSDNTARAGLMARVSTNANSQFVFWHVTPESPGLNRVVGQLRATTGGTAAGWGTNTFPAGLPNGWLRLRRVGNDFIGYRSTNGVDWVETGRTTQGLPSALLLGLATTSHNTTNPATATYRDLYYVPPPVIVVPPAPAAATVGSTATFSVAARGDDLTYQWRFNSVALAGQTNATLTITNVQSANVGSYDVILVNSAGSVTSAPVSLVIATQPTIVLQPQSTLATNGRPAQLRVVAVGNALSYQWYREGTPVPDGTNSILRFTNAQPSHAGTYFAVITNIVGQATSQLATLTVLVPPSILASPQSLSVPEGGTAVLTVAADGNPAPQYQWRFNTNVLAGETNASLVLPNVQLVQAGAYDVLVSNRVGMVTSAVAVLTVTRTVRAANPAFASGSFGAAVASETGKSYWLEYKDSLNATNWIALPEQPGTGGLLNLTDPAATAPKRFYRIGERTP